MGIYVCLECGESRPDYIKRAGSNLHICKSCSVLTTKDKEGKIVEAIYLDDMVVESVILLNQNGFKTIHSCEGHYLGKLDTPEFIGYPAYISIEVKELKKIPSQEELAEAFIFQPDINTLPNKFRLLTEAIPDKIDDFSCLYEITTGPRNFEDRTPVQKIVLRIEPSPELEIANQLDFAEKKLKCWSKFHISLMDFMEAGLDWDDEDEVEDE